MKLRSQIVPPPIAATDVVSKEYGDTNYSGGAGTDTTAIHDDTAGEINAVALKAAPVAADVILIEDSADSFNKKKATLTDLLGGSSGPIAAAQGDYVTALLGTDYTTALVLPQRVPFDTIGSQRGDLSVDLVTNIGRVTGLKAGRTYHLYGSVVTSTTASYFQYRWYDLTEGEYVGNDALSISNNRTSTVSDTPGATHLFTPVTDTEVELRIHTTSDVNYDINGDNFTQIIVHEIGAVQADVVGGLEFMDIIEVTSVVQDVDFGASGDGAFLRALDGDVDESYFIEAYIPDAGLATSYSLQPNGISANQRGAFVYAGTTGPIDGVSTTLQFGSNAVGRESHSTVEFQAKSGKNRALQANCVDSDGSTIYNFEFAALWSDTSTVINSLRIHGGVASSIPIGSRFVLWRRTTANLRADSAAVYERMAAETVDPGALATTERTVGHSIYGGSIVGISARVENAVTAGSITINVKADGVTKLTAVLDTTNSTSKVERLAIGLAKFAADENISVEFVPTAYDNAGSLASAVTVQVHLTNSGLITQNDRVVARTVLGANATTISLVGLNGDLDAEYEVVGRLKMNTLAAFNISWLPNGLTADMSIKSYADAAVNNSAVGVFLNVGAVTNALEFEFRARFFAGRGVTKRGLECTGNAVYNLSTLFTFQAAGYLINDTDNITSLDFVSSVASGFLAGSWVEVRRVKA